HQGNERFLQHPVVAAEIPDKRARTPTITRLGNPGRSWGGRVTIWTKGIRMRQFDGNVFLLAVLTAAMTTGVAGCAGGDQPPETGAGGSTATGGSTGSGGTPSATGGSGPGSGGSGLGTGGATGGSPGTGGVTPPATGGRVGTAGSGGGT